MANPQSQVPSGLAWEAHRRQMDDEARVAVEQRRRESRDQIAAQTSNLGFRMRISERNNPATPSSRLYHGSQMYELETRQDPEGLRAPPTPPVSEYEGPTSQTIPDLQRQIASQGRAIEELESKLQAEQTKVRNLQYERHQASCAQTEAVRNRDYAELANLRQQVSTLAELLDESKKQERELEQQIDEGRGRERELKKQLADAEDQVQELQRGSRVTSLPDRTETRPPTVHIRTREQAPRQSENQATENAVRDLRQRTEMLERQRDPSAASNTTPSIPSRKSGRQSHKYGYVSIPRGVNRMINVGFLT